MAELPILPLKTDAILADTQHMSAEEFGVYCRLLFTMWRHDARLHDDPAELARIGGVSDERWAAISERVMRPMTRAGGMISQKRLSSTWLDVKELRKKRALAAQKRWGSRAYPNEHADAQADNHHEDEPGNANQNQIRTTSEFQNRARDPDPPVEGVENPLPAGSLASAQPSGALSRQPDAEQKPPHQATRAEIEAAAERRRQKDLIRGGYGKPDDRRTA